MQITLAQLTWTLMVRTVCVHVCVFVLYALGYASTLLNLHMQRNMEMQTDNNNKILAYIVFLL